MLRLFKLLGAFLAIAVLCGCSDQRKSSTASDKLTVFSSIPPITYIVQQLGGDKIDAYTLIPEGQSPHTFTPKPSNIKALENAKLYITVDLPFETNVIMRLLQKSNIPICDASAGITKIPVATEHEHGEKGHEGHVHNETMDPHIWLSPANDLIIAKNIYEKLRELNPPNANYYQANYEAFVKKINQVNSRLEKVMKPFKGRTFYVYHPAFGYFAHAYGLEQEAVECEGKSPSPKHISELITHAKSENVKFIFVQPQFSERSAQIIAEKIGGKVIRLDPLAYNLLENYEKIAKDIGAALETEK